MLKKFFLFLGLFAALAASSLAQNIDFQPGSVSGSYIGSLDHPRLALDRASGVKASVIVNTAEVERRAFAMINQKRIENGLQPLTWSNDIAVIARGHSRNMAQYSFFSHRGKDGKLVSDRADAAGLGTWQSIGENIAFNRGYSDPIEKAMELWLDSPQHRQNLLSSNWQESAVGVAVADDGSYYFTQVFLRK